MSPQPHNRWDTPEVKEDSDAFEDDQNRGMPDV